MVGTTRSRLAVEFVQYRCACIRDHSLQRSHFSFGIKSFVEFKGKGRKERAVPLWHSTAKALQAWFRELDDSSSAFAFPNARGSSLTRDGVNYILQQAVERASLSCLSLKNKRVFPHIFRHYLPFLTMSSNGERLRIRIGDFRSRPAKPQNITRHSLMLGYRLFRKARSRSQGLKRPGVAWVEMSWQVLEAYRRLRQNSLIADNTLCAGPLPPHGPDGRLKYYVGAASRICWK